MDIARPARARDLRRILWAALALCLGWFALSLVFPASSASAEERHGSGLLGVVGQTVDTATSTVSHVTQHVDSVVGSAVTTVAPVVEPAVAPVPAPVREPVAEVVSSANQAVQNTVTQLDSTVTGVVGTATDLVGGVADSGIVSGVTEPVVDLVTSVPVVGGVVEKVGLDDTVRDVAAGTDEVVSGVVGSPAPVSGVLPTPPTGAVDVIVDTVRPGGPDAPTLPGIGDGVVVPLPSPVLPTSPINSAPGAGGAVEDPVIVRADAASTAASAAPTSSASTLPPGISSAAVAAQAAASGGSSPASPDPGTPPSPTAPATPQTSAGSGSVAAGSGGPGTSPADSGGSFGIQSLALLSPRTVVNDALPGAPVYDTDVSPD